MKKSILIFIFLIISNYSLCQTGWINQSTCFPSNNNHTYSSIYALSSSVCYMTTRHLSTPMLDSNNYMIFKTSNAGLNWSLISQGNGYYIRAVQFINENTAYAVGGHYYYYPTLENDYGQVVTKSTNGGVNWVIVFEIDMPLINYSIEYTSLSFVDANTGWVCAMDGGIRKTTNGGINWTAQVTPTTFNKTSIRFANSQYGWVTGSGGNIAYTTNGGVNWLMQTSGTTNKLNSVLFIDLNTGWACGQGGSILKTVNSGTNWIFQNYNTTDVYNSLAFINSNSGWIAGNNKVIATTNGGNNWTEQLSNSNASFESISFCSTQVGWVCGSRSVYATTSGGTNIKKTGTNIPGAFKLYQNYPNPFNPVTKIMFDIPPFEGGIGGMLVLKVYNILGKEIETLVNEKKSLGTYEITFDGNRFASGVYFYTLFIDKFSETKKMLILK